MLSAGTYQLNAESAERFISLKKKEERKWCNIKSLSSEEHNARLRKGGNMEVGGINKLGLAE